MSPRTSNIIFYTSVILAPALTVPWLFTEPAGEPISGFPPWALWVVITTIGYCCLLAWGLGRSDWGED